MTDRPTSNDAFDVPAYIADVRAKEIAHDEALIQQMRDLVHKGHRLTELTVLCMHGYETCIITKEEREAFDKIGQRIVADASSRADNPFGVDIGGPYLMEVVRS